MPPRSRAPRTCSSASEIVPFKPSKTIVELTRIVETILVEDQGVGQGTDLQQAMPVAVVPRQPGDFQAQHDAGIPQAHLGDQVLKALPVRCRGPRLALVVVDDQDTFDGPTQGDRPLPQRVLPLGALAVFHDLAERRLTNVQICIALKMTRCNLRGITVHGGTSVCASRVKIMLASREAADRRRCEGTVTPSTARPNPRSRDGSGAGWGQAFIQATKPRRISIAYP